jgi:hypothetical protein
VIRKNSGWRLTYQFVFGGSHNPKVVGSNPAPATKKSIGYSILAVTCFFYQDVIRTNKTPSKIQTTRPAEYSLSIISTKFYKENVDKAVAKLVFSEIYCP